MIHLIILSSLLSILLLSSYLSPALQNFIYQSAFFISKEKFHFYWSASRCIALCFFFLSTLLFLFDLYHSMGLWLQMYRKIEWEYNQYFHDLVFYSWLVSQIFDLFSGNLFLVFKLNEYSWEKEILHIEGRNIIRN